MSQQTNKPNTRPCKFFATKKGCNKGAECSFEHGKTSQAEQPDVDPNNLSNYSPNNSSLLAYFAGHRPVVAKVDVELIKELDANGCRYWTRAKAVGKHSRSAYYRALAAHEVITHYQSKYGKHDTVLDVLNWFGGERLPRLAPRSDRLSFNVYSAPDTPIRGDMARGFRRDGLPPGGGADMAYVLDVYHDITSTPDNPVPFGIPSLEFLFSQPEIEHVYYICRKFDGRAGWEYKGMKVEGCWIKDDHDQVIFSPHKGGLCYNPHPAPIIGHDRTLGRFDVSEISILGPFHVYHITEGHPQGLPLRPLNPHPGRVQLRRLNTHSQTAFRRLVGVLRIAPYIDAVATRSFSLLGRNYYSPDHEYLVDTALVSRVGPTLKTRPVSGISQDRTTVQLTSLTVRDEGLNALEERFPDFYDRLCQETYYFALYGGRVERGRRERDLRAQTLDADNDLKWARDPASVNPTQSNWLFTAACVALGAAVLARWSIKLLGVTLPGSACSFSPSGLNPYAIEATMRSEYLALDAVEKTRLLYSVEHFGEGDYLPKEQDCNEFIARVVHTAWGHAYEQLWKIPQFLGLLLSNDAKAIAADTHEAATLAVSTAAVSLACTVTPSYGWVAAGLLFPDTYLPMLSAMVWGFAGPVAGVASCFQFHCQSRGIAGSTVNLLAPVIEESISAQSLSVATGMYAIEAGLYLAGGTPPISVAGVVAMHVLSTAVTRRFGRFYGGVIHFAWNVAAVSTPLLFPGHWAITKLYDMEFPAGRVPMWGVLAAVGVATVCASVYWPRMRHWVRQVYQDLTQTTPENLKYDSWLEDYYLFAVDQEPEPWCEPIPVGSTIRAVNAQVEGPHPDGVRGSITLFVDGSRVTISEAFELFLKKPLPDTPAFWPIIGISSQMYTPARSELNLLVALLQRAHRNLPADRPDEDDLLEPWLAAFDNLLDHVQPVPYNEGDRPATLAEALCNAKASRRDQILRAQDDMELRDYKDKKRVFMKAVEHLPLKELEFTHQGDGAVYIRTSIKPRLLANLPLSNHAETAQAAKALVAGLKRTMSGQPRAWTFSFEGETYHTTLRLFYCAGRANGAPGGADDCFNAMIYDPGFVVGFCGDDNVFSLGEWAGMLRLRRFHWGDYSMMDSTLGPSAIISGFHRWSERYGVAYYMRRRFTHHMSTPYSARYGDLVVLGDSEPQFTTGTTITSGNQSMITATQITSYLRNPGQSIIKHAASLGLKLKAGSTDDIYAVDFLHMTLLPVTLLNGEVRNVLAPHSGAFTKWAKISSDPRVVTKIKGKQRLEAGVALRVVADAVAKSHAEIPDNFPILGNLLRKFRSLGLDSSAYDIQPGQVIREYNYKPRVTKFTLSSDQRVFALERQAERYDCTIDDLLEVEALIDSVTSLPSFIMHPLLHKMATRDYA